MLRLTSAILLFAVAVSASWKFLSQMELSAVGGRVPAICEHIPGLSRRQRRLCQAQPELIPIVRRGAHLGVSHCQDQFQNERWNCSTMHRGSGKDNILLKLGSREAAFVHAITSAGVVHSIAQACAQGQLRACSCAQSLHGLGQDKLGHLFTWGGCGDNVAFASAFTRRFLDAPERKSRDGKALMNLHNNRAGRKIVKRKLKLKCKCHGVSGSCTTRTCWMATADFSDVSQHLYHKYRRALQVTLDPERAELIPSNPSLRLDSPFSRGKQPSDRRSQLTRRQKKLAGSSLVFFASSPDYCRQDPKIGSLGTAGRRCNKTSTGADSCELLCCGRGFHTTRVVETTKCQCKFVWCCNVKCRTCEEVKEISTCKGYGGETPRRRHQTLHRA